MLGLSRPTAAGGFTTSLVGRAAPAAALVACSMHPCSHLATRAGQGMPVQVGTVASLLLLRAPIRGALQPRCAALPPYVGSFVWFTTAAPSCKLVRGCNSVHRWGAASDTFTL
jgi:hypothetical protein